jgi:hypothetical protein
VSGAVWRWLRLVPMRVVWRLLQVPMRVEWRLLQVPMRAVWWPLQVPMMRVGLLLQVRGRATLGLLLGSPARLFAAREMLPHPATGHQPGPGR